MPLVCLVRKDMKKGKFIVIYGANNLGKTVQANMLIEKLKMKGKDSFYLKYPIYDLEPTGPIINSVLREGVKMSDLDLQKTFAQNRKDFKDTLVGWLKEGKWPVTEDYKGTGIGWGVANGIPLETMEELNKGLLDEDLAILLDGERFTSGIERDHRHESGDKWEKARQVHSELGKRYGWETINANQSIEKVSADIWEVVEKVL